MTLILTSSPGLEEHNGLNPANSFVTELRKLLKNNAKLSYVASEPDMYDLTQEYAMILKNDFECSSFSFKKFTVIDRRNQDKAKEIIEDSDIVILSGGHVPTQNKFFRELKLKDILKNYDGIVMGISAGTMNSASVVYCAPELEGEAIDKEFNHFIDGLGLTEINVMPHFNITCSDILDGFYLYRDIVVKDSYKRKIYALPDGSFFINDKLYGPAYLFENGKITAL